MLFIDEGWHALNDAYFQKMINDWSRTPRKKNNIFGLATQVANDAAQLSISKALHESAACKIFFPNPGADRQVYIDIYPFHLKMRSCILRCGLHAMGFPKGESRFSPLVIVCKFILHTIIKHKNTARSFKYSHFQWRAVYTA